MIASAITPQPINAKRQLLRAFVSFISVDSIGPSRQRQSANACDPAAARCELDRQSGFILYDALNSLVITSDPISIDAVFVFIQLVASLGKKREAEIEVTTRPISHSANIPNPNMPECNNS